MERETLHRFLRDMLLARAFEERAAEEYAKGNIVGFLHLYPGEEAVGVGLIHAAEPADYIVSTYREHVHALARGVPPEKVMAELFGRRTGMSGGMGGSMHLFDRERRFMGGYAIVGETYPLATGIAYGIAMRKLPEAVICLFGDGAVNQGTFHEALNMAALWRLPVLFACENNHYGIGTEIHRHSAVTDVYKRAAGYNIPAEKVDGMDVVKVHEASQRALQRIRAGDGPQFIEFDTYRYRGHSMADPGAYRPAVELKAYQAHDPISAEIRELECSFPNSDEVALAGIDNVGRLAEHMRKTGHATEQEVAQIRESVNKVVEDAVAFAKQSPEPTMDAAWRAMRGGLEGAPLTQQPHH